MTETIASALDGLCRPDLVRLRPNLVAVRFDLMKIVPARFILEDALRSGALAPGGLVIESSSGTFALGLALCCVNMGLRLRLVTGPMEPSLRWRLEHLGAVIDAVPATLGGLGGIQQARLDRLQALMADVPGAFWPQQYTNPLHPAAYAPLARGFVDALGKVDYLVASVGSGGSLCGMGRVLRAANPDVKLIAVDHNLSVLFGPTSGRVNALCRECYVPLLGMGSDIVIPNLEHRDCDEVHWLPVAPMIRAVHHLHRTYGLLVGPTAGAAFAVADWIARARPEAKVLTIFPDHGIRYLGTIFDEQWLATRGEELQRAWPEPRVVDSPRDVAGAWERYPWARRSYAEVLGHPPVSRS
jgi:cysteine synthase